MMRGQGERELTPSQWKRLERLLDAALELPGDSRKAFVDRECGDDVRLRVELYDLLAEQDRSGILDRPVPFLETSATVNLAVAVSPGTVVAHYEIQERLGSGGMGVVYRARDLRLERSVALKFLPAVLGQDARAKRRFLIEARAAASLEHPNICTVHEIGETSEGLLFIAMAFVEGESLRQAIERGPLPVARAVDIARQIAAALHGAHQRGVVHRDVKPPNVMLGSDGVVKLVDFGVAKLEGSTLTAAGATPGTVAYMSPEQVKGEEVDHRADLWALGVVLYEMLAGHRPFLAESDAATLHAITTATPVRLRTLRESVPPYLEGVIARALTRDREQRFQSAAEVSDALRIGEADFTGSVVVRLQRAMRSLLPRSHKVRTRLALGVGITLALALGLSAGRFFFAGSAPPPTRYWHVMLPEATPLALTGPGPLGIWQSALALSPAGDVLAYATPRSGSTAIVVRPLDHDSSTVLPGTTGAYHPFFSPDGSWIGYFSGHELRKVRAVGGSPVALTTVDRPVGAVWLSADRILLFQQDGFQLRWVSAAGGSDSTILLGTQFGTPEVLPGGRYALGQISSGQLALISLADGRLSAITRRGVVPLDSVDVSDLLFGASPKYSPSGHIVFGSGDGVLMALPFDVGSLRVTGEPVPVVTGVRIEEGYGFAEFALAPDGTLVFVPGVSQLFGHIAYVDPSGRFDTLPFPRAQYTQPRLSPDGTRLATQRRKEFGGWEVLVMDLGSGVIQRVDVEGNYRAFPAAWAPDGKTLMFGLWDPVQFLVAGARLYSLGKGTWTTMPPFKGSYMTIAPNGEDFVYSDWRTGELFVRKLVGDTTRTRIPARGFAASFSPDGRWLAWGSVDGGVAVSPLPPTGAIFSVSERGQQPLWSPDGRRLIYRDGRRFYHVDVDARSGFRTGRAQLLADGPFIRTFAWNHTIGPDGRLAVLLSAPGESTRNVRVITGFRDVLRRLAPPDDQR